MDSVHTRIMQPTTNTYERQRRDEDWQHLAPQTVCSHGSSGRSDELVTCVTKRPILTEKKRGKIEEEKIILRHTDIDVLQANTHIHMQ